MSQPLVRQYVKNQKTLGSIYGKLSKKAPAAASFIKYFAANEVIEKFVPSDIANPLYDSVDKYNINKLITDRIIYSQQYALSFYGKNENGVVSKMSKKVNGKELIEGLTANLDSSGKGISHILAISVINPSFLLNSESFFHLCYLAILFANHLLLANSARDPSWYDLLTTTKEDS